MQFDCQIWTPRCQQRRVIPDNSQWQCVGTANSVVGIQPQRLTCRSGNTHVADCDGTAVVDRATRRGQRDTEPYLKA